MTASQKDGVVRIWSWNADPAAAASNLSPPTQHKDGPVRNISHILIKLTNPNSSASNEVRQGPRARPNRSQTRMIACDVAVWISDDTKIVTSQSELAKQRGNDIVACSCGTVSMAIACLEYLGHIQWRVLSFFLILWFRQSFALPVRTASSSSRIGKLVNASFRIPTQLILGRSNLASGAKVLVTWTETFLPMALSWCWPTIVVESRY